MDKQFSHFYNGFNYFTLLGLNELFAVFVFCFGVVMLPVLD